MLLSKQPKLSRRRGTAAAAGGGSKTSFRRTILCVVATAFLLTAGFLILACYQAMLQVSKLPGHERDTFRHKVQLAVPNLLRGKQGALKLAVGGGAGAAALKKAPAPHLQTGTAEYPYALQVVPADYDIRAQWTPLGGNRFDEYKNGDSPYQITDALKTKSDELARSRRYHVKKAMQFAWNGYTQYAFGMDEVLPQSKRGENNWGGQGITLVDSLDTLWLMDMKEEFWKARDWVRDHLHHDAVDAYVSVFETTIRDLGGLLSAYDWSHDIVFLEKALDLGKRLIRAFDDTSTGIPSGQVHMLTGQTQNIAWTSNNAILAEFASIQIENRYLSKLTGVPEFKQKTEKIFDILNEISPPNGLFPYFVRNNHRVRQVEGQAHDLLKSTGMLRPEFANNKLTFGAMADSTYEYMLKVWLQGGKTEPLYRNMYDKAMAGMHAELLQKSNPSGLTFIADEDGAGTGNLDRKMDHLVCFMGGLLALGAYTDPLGFDSARAQRDLKTAKALTYTCYQMYARMNTGISAEYVQFVDGKDFEIGRGAPHYLLRPEAVESFFILNQLTGDPIYREWGWEVFQSIEKYCKTDIGYGSLTSVADTQAPPRDKMESFFLAETLKYLYLLMDPDTEVDILNTHVFNTEAHPLRIFPVLDAVGDTGLVGAKNKDAAAAGGAAAAAQGAAAAAAQ